MDSAGATDLLGLRDSAPPKPGSTRSLDTARANSLLGLRPPPPKRKAASQQASTTGSATRPKAKPKAKTKANAKAKAKAKSQAGRPTRPDRSDDQASCATRTDAATLAALAPPDPANFGKHLCCPPPCTWKPDFTRPSNRWRTEACTHWRRCRGELPPRAPEDHHLFRSKALAQHYSTARTNAAHRKWKLWLDSLPATARANTCSPDLDTPTTRFFSKNQQLNYTCTSCSRSCSLRRFKEGPCKSRTAGSITMRQFRLLTLKNGAEYNSKHHQARMDWRRAVVAKAKAKAKARPEAKAKAKAQR